MAQQRFRTVTRVVSRALLVAGFAGTVWLLSSAAAHAAAPEQSAVPGTERGTVSLTAPITRTAVNLLGAVLAPRNTATPHASRAASPAAPEHRPVVRDRVTGAVPVVLDLLRPLTGAVLRPGTGALAELIAPVTSSLRLSPAPVTRRVAPAAGTPTRLTPPAVPAGQPAAARTPARRPAATGHLTVRVSRRFFDSGTRQVPVLPDRTPAPAYPGSGNTGISTTASGSHLGGGAFAAGTQVPGGQPADRTGLDATEAPVRLLLAEAPVFSPD
jgi:hypothetical protein